MRTSNPRVPGVDSQPRGERVGQPQGAAASRARPDPLYRPLTPLVIAAVAVLARLRVLGAAHVPRHGPVLLAANHVSHLDPLVLAVALHRCGRRVRFLAVSGVFETPVVGWLLRNTGMIPVVRGTGPERMVTDALPVLRAGEAVLVYPEGTIPRPGERLPGKPGAGLLALECGAPVVPLGHYGLGHEGRCRLRRPAAVVFGPPLDLTRWGARRDHGAQVEVSAALLEAVRALEASARRAASATGRRTPTVPAGAGVSPWEPPGTR